MIITAIQIEYDQRLINDLFDFSDALSVYYDPDTAEINIDDDVTEKQLLDISKISLNSSSVVSYFPVAAANSKLVIDNILNCYKYGFDGIKVPSTTTAQKFSIDRNTIRSEFIRY